MQILKPSERIQSLSVNGGDSWDIFEFSRKMISHGDSIVELTIGEHDIKTDPKILTELYTSACNGNTGYAPVRGIVELREVVAKRVEERTGVTTKVENVIITSGGQSALFASHHAVCEPNDIALFCDPYYATYPGTIRAVGAIPKTVLAHPKDGFQLLEQNINIHATNAKSLLINSPNNPTGVIYSEKTLIGIANSCKKNNLWLISDEVYDTQVWKGKHISPRSIPGMEERTLVIGSMSKSHAMTGSRIGWVVGPEEIIHHMIQLATHTTYGVPGYIQEAALFAINQGKTLEEAISAPFRRRNKIANKVFSNQNLLKPVLSSGGMYVMLDIRNTGLSGKEFAKELLKERKIAVMPGESFGFSASGHVRLALTVEDNILEDALREIIAFSKKYAHKD
jgi:arginine:pyruvate transaminase